MKVLNEIAPIHICMEEKTTTYIVQFNETEQTIIDNLEFYINSLIYPKNYVYDNDLEKEKDKELFEEYKTLNNLMKTIFINNTDMCEIESYFPGAFCCSIDTEKASCNNLAFVHVTEYYNIE